MGFWASLVGLCKGGRQLHILEDRSELECSRDLLSSFDRFSAPFLDPLLTKENSSATSNKGEFADDSFFIFCQVPAPLEYLDSMLIDPAVECLNNQNRGVYLNDEVMEGHTMEDHQSPIAANSYPRIKEANSFANYDISSIGRPVILNLSHVPFEDISNIEIIDDFEDYYIDEEELMGNPNLSTVEDNVPSLDEENLKGDKAIYIHMDQLKFLLYRHIQEVDGFAHFARARAWGSNKLSPFKPEPLKKKISKRLQGLDSPISVRRSPRLKSR